METINSIELIVGLVWGTAMLILWRRSKPKVWPLIFGIGGGTYMLVLLIIRNLLLRPISGFMTFNIANFFWSLIFGIVCYFSGRILARRFPNEKDYNHKRK